MLIHPVKIVIITQFFINYMMDKKIYFFQKTYQLCELFFKRPKMLNIIFLKQSI